MENERTELKNASLAYTLKASYLFADLRAEDLSEVLAFAVAKPVSKGDYLFREGDKSHGFYVVQNGSISIHRVNAIGYEQVMHMFRAGESFGEGSLTVSEGYPADARAEEPSRVILIPRQDFIDLLGRRPDLAMRMLATMSLRLRMLLAQIENLTVKDVESRLMAWLTRRCPDSRSEEPHTIELTFSKKVLASELGTVSETLSRNLGHLRDEGYVEVKGKAITVLNPNKLRIFLESHLSARSKSASKG